MKKTLIILAAGILIGYAAIAALMLDFGGIFSGSAGTGDGTFVVTFVLNDEDIGSKATIEGGVATVTCDEGFILEAALPKADPNNRSFVFGGWYVAGTRVYDFSDVQMAKGRNETVQVVAYWSFKTFTIGETMFEMVMKLNGGALYDSNYDRAIFGSLDRALPTPVRAGYLFGGWYYEGVYSDTNKVATHEEIVPVWDEDNRPNFITLVALWNVRA